MRSSILLALLASFAAPAAAQAGGPRCRLDPPKVDGYELPTGRQLEYRLQISNTGSDPLVILSARARNPKMYVQVERERIPAGGTGGIYMRLPAGAIGDPFREEVSIKTNDPNKALHVFSIGGSVVDPPKPEAPAAKTQAGETGPSTQPGPGPETARDAGARTGSPERAPAKASAPAASKPGAPTSEVPPKPGAPDPSRDVATRVAVGVIVLAFLVFGMGRLVRRQRGGEA